MACWLNQKNCKTGTSSRLGKARTKKYCGGFLQVNNAVDATRGVGIALDADLEDVPLALKESALHQFAGRI